MEFVDIERPEGVRRLLIPAAVVAKGRKAVGAYADDPPAEALEKAELLPHPPAIEKTAEAPEPATRVSKRSK